MSEMHPDDRFIIPDGRPETPADERAVRELASAAAMIINRDGPTVALDALLTLYVSFFSHARGLHGCATTLRAFADARPPGELNR